MSRRSSPTKREILPDPVYQSVTITKFINVLMERGKKSTAERILYGALEIVAKKSGEEALEAFQKAINNIKPSVEVKSRRVGGATYQVPMEVPPSRRKTLAIRWLLDSAQARSGKSFAEKLADELMDAYKNEGASVRKREETHKMAEANRAFSHYRL